MYSESAKVQRVSIPYAGQVSLRSRHTLRIYAGQVSLCEACAHCMQSEFPFEARIHYGSRRENPFAKLTLAVDHASK